MAPFTGAGTLTADMKCRSVLSFLGVFLVSASIYLMILGNLTLRHQELFYKNPLFAGVRLPEVKEVEPLARRYPKLSAAILDLAKVTDYFGNALFAY